MEALTVERTIWINARRERVWEAITTAEQINRWWSDDHWEIDALKVGGTVRFGYGNDQVLATIEVLEPPRQFTMKWPPVPPYSVITSYTTYLLADENGGTRVTVSETGFEALPEDTRQERYDSNSRGYEKILAGLKAYVEGQG
jgi:uncharacterized protein YndB with AHSA1/START domain